MNPIEIDYELEPKDYVEYSKIAARRQKSHRPLVVLLFLFFILFICADIITAFVSGSLENLDAVSIGKNLAFRLLLLFLFVGIFTSVVRFFQLRLGKKVAENEKNGIFCQHKIVINESELIEITDVNLSRQAWINIGQIEDVENLLLITTNASMTYIIPKRCFQEQNHIQKFLDTAIYFQKNASQRYQPSYLIQYDKTVEQISGE